jgi:hypothetical protein
MAYATRLESLWHYPVPAYVPIVAAATMLIMLVIQKWHRDHEA